MNKVSYFSLVVSCTALLVNCSPENNKEIKESAPPNITKSEALIPTSVIPNPHTEKELIKQENEKSSHEFRRLVTSNNHSNFIKDAYPKIITNKNSETFIFHGNGFATVFGPFDELLGTYRTNNDNPDQCEKIQLIKEQGKSAVYVGSLGLKGGCEPCLVIALWVTATVVLTEVAHERDERDRRNRRRRREEEGLDKEIEKKDKEIQDLKDENDRNQKKIDDKQKEIDLLETTNGVFKNECKDSIEELQKENPKSKQIFTDNLETVDFINKNIDGVCEGINRLGNLAPKSAKDEAENIKVESGLYAEDNSEYSLKVAAASKAICEEIKKLINREKPDMVYLEAFKKILEAKQAKYRRNLKKQKKTGKRLDRIKKRLSKLKNQIEKLQYYKDYGNYEGYTSPVSSDADTD